jgi:hypothetical protein
MDTFQFTVCKIVPVLRLIEQIPHLQKALVFVGTPNTVLYSVAKKRTLTEFPTNIEASGFLCLELFAVKLHGCFFSLAKQTIKHQLFVDC